MHPHRAITSSPDAGIVFVELANVTTPATAVTEYGQPFVDDVAHAELVATRKVCTATELAPTFLLPRKYCRRCESPSPTRLMFWMSPHGPPSQKKDWPPMSVAWRADNDSACDLVRASMRIVKRYAGLDARLKYAARPVLSNPVAEV